MTIYGIDHGNANTGIAKGIEVINMATPYRTVKTAEIKDFFAKEKVNENFLFVIGLPISMSGRYSSQTFNAIDFGVNIKKNYNSKVYFIDERMTSQVQFSETKGKVNSKKVKQHKDVNAGVIILNKYFENKNSAVELIFEEPSDIKLNNSCKEILIKDVCYDTEYLKDKNFFVYAKNPYVFWYYFSRGIKSTTILSDFENNFDCIISSEEIKYIKK